MGEQDAVLSLQTYARTPSKILEVAQWLLTVTRACDVVLENRRMNAVTRVSQARLLATALNLRADLDRKKKAQLLRLWETVTFRIYGMYCYDARTRVGDYVRLAWRVVNEQLPHGKIEEELKKIGSEFPIGEAIDELRNTDCYSDWGEELRYFFPGMRSIWRRNKVKISKMNNGNGYGLRAQLTLLSIFGRRVRGRNHKYTALEI
jgi:hypothetical protein